MSTPLRASCRGGGFVLRAALLFAQGSAVVRAQEAPAGAPRTAEDPIAALRASFGGETFEAELEKVAARIEAAPQDTELLLATAVFLCNERSDVEHGERFAKLLVERAGDRPGSYPPLFSVYFLRGAQTELDALAEAAVKRFPDDPVTLFNHGLACQRSLRSTLALASLTKAAELRPDNALYRFAIADVLEQMRRYPEAEQAYQRCLALEPLHPGARAGLAQVLGFEGRDEEAEQAFRSALEAGIGEAGYPYALFLLQRRRFQEALPFLRKTVDLFPDHRMAWNNLARCQKALGNEKASQRALRKFRELQEKFVREEDERLQNILKAREHERGASKESAEGGEGKDGGDGGR